MTKGVVEKEMAGRGGGGGGAGGKDSRTEKSMVMPKHICNMRLLWKLPPSLTLTYMKVKHMLLFSKRSHLQRLPIVLIDCKDLRNIGSIS